MTDAEQDTTEALDARSSSEELDTPRPKRRVYHVALTPDEVIERLREQPGLALFTRAEMPDFGGVAEQAEFTVEVAEREFTVHCGPPAARGQSATGMLRLLYLRARLRPTGTGTRIELSFAHRRPRWALQRWVGFLMLASAGLAWVLLAPGVVAKKAMLYGALLLVLAPVIVHDLRQGERVEEQRRALLNLIEHSFGPLALGGPHPDEPYRRGTLGTGDGGWEDEGVGDPDEDEGD